MKAKGTYSIFLFRFFKYFCIFMILILLIPIKAYAGQTEYEYDDLGRIVKVTYEDGSWETYEYDQNGNITVISFHEEDGENDGRDTEDENPSSGETGGNEQDSTGESDSTAETGDSAAGAGEYDEGNTRLHRRAKVAVMIIIPVILAILIVIYVIHRRNSKDH